MTISFSDACTVASAILSLDIAAMNAVVSAEYRLPTDTTDIEKIAVLFFEYLRVKTTGLQTTETACGVFVDDGFATYPQYQTRGTVTQKYSTYTVTVFSSETAPSVKVTPANVA